MSKTRLAICGLLFVTVLATPLRAADPPLINPLKGLVHSPLSAEFEVYTGGITGQGIGKAFQSAAQGDYGLRFTVGFLKSLSLSLNYTYSNQTRTLTEGLPPVGGLPTGTIFLRAANLNMVFGNGEFNFLNTRHTVIYLSPGMGFARNSSRHLTVTTPLGLSSFPVSSGTAVAFNLGAGLKIYPRKRWGVRFDLRDFVSGGGTGSLSSGPPKGILCSLSFPSCQNPGAVLGDIPVNNNLVFTVGLIFKLL